MRCDHDGLLVVRADLSDRLDRLQRAAERMSIRDLGRDLDTMAMLAAAYGLKPVAALAEAFARAIRAQPRGCPASLYFERLRDAIGCQRVDAQVQEALLASVSIRLHS